MLKLQMHVHTFEDHAPLITIEVASDKPIQNWVAWKKWPQDSVVFESILNASHSYCLSIFRAVNVRKGGRWKAEVVN